MKRDLALLTPRRLYRSLCILCGLLGLGIYVQVLRLGGRLSYVGIIALLIGLITGSLVVHRWQNPLCRESALPSQTDFLFTGLVPSGVRLRSWLLDLFG